VGGKDLGKSRGAGGRLMACRGVGSSTRPIPGRSDRNYPLEEVVSQTTKRVNPVANGHMARLHVCL